MSGQIGFEWVPVKKAKSYGGSKLRKRSPTLCRNCSKTYLPKTPSRISFCSRECAFEYKSTHAKGRPRFCTISFYNCSICTSPFARHRTNKNSRSKVCKACSPIRKKLQQELFKASAQYKRILAAKREKNRSKQAISRICIRCGKAFTCTLRRWAAKYCARKCARKAQKRTREYHKRAKGGKISVVRFNEIWIRDQGKCQLCGKKANRKLKPPHPLAATIDHIKPLSKGGAHESINVQIAHFICNSRRSDRGAGQYRLF